MLLESNNVLVTKHLYMYVVLQYLIEFNIDKPFVY